MAISNKDLEQCAGAGVSDDPRDTAQNAIRLLQKTSKEIDRRDPKYVQDAAPGDFLFFGANPPIVKGETGFDFTPVGSQRRFIEWLPDGQGKGGEWPALPPDAEWAEDPKTKKRARRLDHGRGNVVEETVFFSGLVDGELWALPFRSSGLKVYRDLNTQLKKLKLPAFATRWRVTSDVAEFNGNSWFQASFELLGKVNEANGPSDEEFEAARQLYEEYGFAELMRPAAPATALAAPAKRLMTVTIGKPGPVDGDQPAGPRPFAPIDDIPF
jgi:hypothetical protein